MNKMQKMLGEIFQSHRNDAGKSPANTKNTFYLFGSIGASWTEDYVTAKDLNEFLDAAGGEDVTIHINSPGGSCFEGRAMASAIRAYSGKVTAVVDGYAASAAATVMIAADEIIMSSGSMMMIHNAWTYFIGNRIEMMKEIVMMEKLDNSIAEDFASRGAATLDDIRKMMDDETWFTAEEALAMNFCDSIAGKADKSNMAKFDLSCYKKSPALNLDQDPAPAPVPESIDDQSEFIAQQERRLKLFEFA